MLNWLKANVKLYMKKIIVAAALFIPLEFVSSAKNERPMAWLFQQQQ